MQRAWILLTLGLVACVSAESRAELTSDKDMYLDNSSIEEASGVYPIDDDDYASASGSGGDEDIESPELTTSRPLPKIPFTSTAPKVETTTLKTQKKMPAQTKVSLALHHIHVTVNAPLDSLYRRVLLRND
uniref:Uncharacterized protein n=1 Tax=Marmota marmota marmota TaxID=9994 RepID=A0A8C5Z7H7_MARMA